MFRNSLVYVAALFHENLSYVLNIITNYIHQLQLCNWGVKGRRIESAQAREKATRSNINSSISLKRQKHIPGNKIAWIYNVDETTRRSFQAKEHNVDCGKWNNVLTISINTFPSAIQTLNTLQLDTTVQQIAKHDRNNSVTLLPNNALLHSSRERIAARRLINSIQGRSTNL